MTEESGRGDPERISSTAARTWRIRLWVRLLTLIPPVGWAVILLTVGPEGDESALTWTAVFIFVVVVPFLAWWPAVSIRADGTLHVRDWIVVRTVPIDEVVEVAFTSWGLRMTMADGSRMTSNVFQAVRARSLSRVYGFVSALVGQVIEPARFGAFAAALPGGAVLWRRLTVLIPDDMIADGDVPSPTVGATLHVGMRLDPAGRGTTVFGEVTWVRLDESGTLDALIEGDLTVLVRAEGIDDSPELGSPALLQGQLSVIRSREYERLELPDARRDWLVHRVRLEGSRPMVYVDVLPVPVAPASP